MPLRTTGVGKQGNQPDLDGRVIAQCRMGGQHLESQRLHGVGGEDCGGFIEGAVGRRATTAQVVIVHGGQIVMDQGEGMHQLDGDCRRIEHVGRHAQRLARGIDQQRPDPLATTQRRVAHGLVQDRRRHALRRAGSDRARPRCARRRLQPGR